MPKSRDFFMRLNQAISGSAGGNGGGEMYAMRRSLLRLAAMCVPLLTAGVACAQPVGEE